MVLEHTLEVRPREGGGYCQKTWTFAHLMIDPDIVLGGPTGRPESAVLRGSLVGLASGVEAVTDANAADGAKTRQQPLGAALTVSAYVVGGIAAALILRGLRREAPPTVLPEA